MPKSPAGCAAAGATPWGLTSVSGTFYFGGLPQEIVLWNIRRLAEEVMPAFEGGEDPMTEEPY
jgi:hypothetical protein